MRLQEFSCRIRNIPAPSKLAFISDLLGRAWPIGTCFHLRFRLCYVSTILFGNCNGFICDNAFYNLRVLSYQIQNVKYYPPINMYPKGTVKCKRAENKYQLTGCNISFKILYELTSQIRLVGWLCWGLTSQSTIFQSYRDGAIASWVINQYFRGVKCLAQGHNTAAVGLEPRTSRSGVRHSTTEPPRSPSNKVNLR